jgi:hypothetical protein
LFHLQGREYAKKAIYGASPLCIAGIGPSPDLLYTSSSYDGYGKSISYYWGKGNTKAPIFQTIIIGGSYSLFFSSLPHVQFLPVFVRIERREGEMIKEKSRSFHHLFMHETALK